MGIHRPGKCSILNFYTNCQYKKNLMVKPGGQIILTVSQLAPCLAFKPGKLAALSALLTVNESPYNYKRIFDKYMYAHHSMLAASQCHVFVHQP